MTGGAGSASRALLYAGGIFSVAALIWAAASFVDLQDGSTWRQRSRGESGPLFRQVDSTVDAPAFKIIVMLRGVMPVVLLGTAGLTLLLGAAAQQNVPRS